MIKTKVAFLEGRLLSSQSEQYKKYSKSTNWLEKKPALRKSNFCFDHVNRLILNHDNVHDKNTSDVMKQNVWATATRFDSCSRDYHQAEYEKEHIKKTHAHLIFMVTENYFCPLNFMCTWSVISYFLVLLMD